MKFLSILGTTALAALFSFQALAMTIDSITFDDKVAVGGRELSINGVGIRKATFLKLKVYYGVLYLTQKTNDANAFLVSNDPKQITMHFVRDVSAKDLVKTYKEAFEGANPATFKSMLPLFETLSANLGNIKEGQRIIFTFLPDGAVLTFAGKTFPKIGDGNFSKALLNMWFINPLDANLSKGLLGQ